MQPHPWQQVRGAVLRHTHWPSMPEALKCLTCTTSRCSSPALLSCGCSQVLETAMSLPGVRSPASPEQAARLAKRGCLASVHERARIYLLLAEVITRIGKPQAATDVRKVGTPGHEVLISACMHCSGLR